MKDRNPGEQWRSLIGAAKLQHPQILCSSFKYYEQRLNSFFLIFNCHCKCFKFIPKISRKMTQSINIKAVVSIGLSCNGRSSLNFIIGVTSSALRFRHKAFYLKFLISSTW